MRRDSMVRELEGMRLQVRRKVERFIARTQASIHIETGAQYIEEIVVQEKVINIGAGAQIHAPVIIAEKIEGSFNVLRDGNLAPDIRSLMEELLTQVAAASKEVPSEYANEFADNVETLAKEVVRDEPRRKWYELSVEGLKEAAAAVGEVGKPILETVGKLLPLLVSMFP